MKLKQIWTSPLLSSLPWYKKLIYILVYPWLPLAKVESVQKLIGINEKEEVKYITPEIAWALLDKNISCVKINKDKSIVIAKNWQDDQKN